MSNIKKINELRKLVKETKWLDINFTKEEAIEGFKAHRVRFDEENNSLLSDNHFLQPKKDESGHSIKGTYVLDDSNFKRSINKKKKTTTKSIGFNQAKVGRYYRYHTLRNHLPEKLSEQLKKDEQTYTCLELRGNWSSYHQPFFTNMVVFVNDFTDEILHVKYNLDDVWFNKFFRDCIDESISNNWEEIHTEKQFNLIYEQRTYKIVSMTALTNEIAQAKAVKEMPELAWKEGRNNGDYTYIGIARDNITETPEGNFRVDTWQSGEVKGIAKEVNHSY